MVGILTKVLVNVNKNTMEKIEKKFKTLNHNELIEINGGGLVEDIGYAAHYIKDKVCEAYCATKQALSDAWDWVRGK